MKFILLTLALVAAVATAAPQQYRDQPVAILRENKDVRPDGSYNYGYETENGISVSEDGVPSVPSQDPNEGPAITASGQYSYTDNEGNQFRVVYTADENGFHPVRTLVLKSAA